MSRPRLFPDAPRPLIFGHRGCAAHAPENTLASFQKALDRGIPGVEFDVHLCASGELVVIHDHSLERLSGSPGSVEGSTLEDLRKRDVGAWYGEEFRGERIPRLEEVFELLGTSVYYDIEIKCERNKGAGIAEKILSLLRQYGLEGHAFLSSFNPYVIAPVQKLNPHIPTAVIYSDSKDLPLLLRKGLGRFVSSSSILKPDRGLVSRTSMFLEKTLLGYTVLSWTVNDRNEAERLLQAGVDGLISDDPAMIRDFVSSRLQTHVS